MQGKTSKFLGATLFSCPIVCSSLSLFRVGKLNWIKCRTTNVCANFTVKCISVLGVMSQKRNKDNRRDKESVRKEEEKKKREELFFKYQRANAQQSCGGYQKVLRSLQSFLFPLLKSKVTYLIVDSAKVGTSQKGKRRNICFILKTTEGALNLGETALSTCFS